MPRRVSIRYSEQASAAIDGGPRRAWVRKWKGWAIAQLPSDISKSDRVQVRIDVERALSRHGPDDDDAELRDVVSSIIEAASARLAAESNAHAHEAAKDLIVNSAFIYLVNSLAKFDRARVSAMLKRPETATVVLTARLKGHLTRHLKGDESQAKVEGRVDAWVGRRLAEQPLPSPAAATGRLTSTLKAAGTVVGAAAVVAYQHPAVKAGVNHSIARAKDIIEQFRTPPPSSPASDPGTSDGIANR
jgi:hypothetical protein